MFFKIITVLLSSFVFNYLFYDYMDTLFQRRIIKIPYLFFYLTTATIMAYVNVFANIYLNYIWGFTFCFILAQFLYKNTSKQNNIFFCIYRFYGLELVIETLGAFLINWMLGDLLSNYFIGVNLGSFMIVCFYILYKKYILNKLDSVAINKDLYLDIFSTFFCFTNIFIISLLSYENLPVYIDVFFLLDAGGFLFMEMYLIMKLGDKEKKTELKNQLKMMEIQQQNDYKYFESRMKDMEQYRKAIHDFKYKLSVLENLYKKNNYHDAVIYSNDLFQELNSMKKFCNHAVLQSILNDIDVRCTQMNIKFTCHIDTRITFKGYKDLDLVSIYSNLLYNAIEANENEKDEIRKFISINITITKEYIHTIISNSYQSIKISQNTLVSTKENHYGIGLKNVKSIIENLNGFISFDYHNHEFKVIFYLPLHEYDIDEEDYIC